MAKILPFTKDRLAISLYVNDLEQIASRLLSVRHLVSNVEPFFWKDIDINKSLLKSISQAICDFKVRSIHVRNYHKPDEMVSDLALLSGHFHEAKLIVLHPQYPPTTEQRMRFGNRENDIYNLLEKALIEFPNLTFTLENMSNKSSNLSLPQQYPRFNRNFGDYQNFGYTLDISHIPYPIRSEPMRGIDRYIKAMRGKLKHIHISETKHKSLPRDISLEEFFKYFDRMGYKGLITFEIRPEFLIGSELEDIIKPHYERVYA